MNIALFDHIHDNCHKRTIPATLEEFIKHGLTPDDFVHYVGLQYRFQSELMRYKSVKENKPLPMTDDKVKSLVIKELVSFCKEKNLIDDDVEWCIHKLQNLYYFDAVYSYEWIKHPMDADEFRLRVERQLSQWWDEEDLLLREVSFTGVFAY